METHALDRLQSRATLPLEVQKAAAAAAAAARPHLAEAAWVAQALAAKAAVPVRSVILWLCVTAVTAKPSAFVAAMTFAECFTAAHTTPDMAGVAGTVAPGSTAARKKGNMW
jgi:hypothetical protein